MGKNKWGLIGICASIIGFIASLIGGWVSDKKMSDRIEEAVERRLGK